MGSRLPAVIEKEDNQSDFKNEREILYKVLFDMKNDLNDLKKLTLDLMEKGNYKDVHEKHEQIKHIEETIGWPFIDRSPTTGQPSPG